MITEFLITNVSILLILLVLTVMLYVNQDLDIPAVGLFRAAILLLLLICVLDFVDDAAAGETVHRFATADVAVLSRIRTITSGLVYILRPVVILLELLLLIEEKRVRMVCIALSVFNGVMYLPALLGFRFPFFISVNNHWHGIRPFNWTVYAVQLLYVLILLVFSIRRFTAARKRENLLILIIALLSFLNAFLEVTELLPGQVDLVTAICILMYYTYLTSVYHHIQNEAIIRKDSQIERDKMTILREQIQPHFIYNSLNVIRTLIRIDSSSAITALDDFSTYLQAHFRAIQHDTLVTLEQELKNVRAYLALAQADYTRQFEIVYDLKATSFRLPPLSLEPLVENAVMHGIPETGGIIRIATESTGDWYIITVTDNGRGNSEDARQPTKHVSVGIQNTRTRLELLCGGSLELTPSPEGMTARIMIAKEKKQ